MESKGWSPQKISKHMKGAARQTPFCITKDFVFLFLDTFHPPIDMVFHQRSFDGPWFQKVATWRPLTNQKIIPHCLPSELTNQTDIIHCMHWLMALLVLSFESWKGFLGILWRVLWGPQEWVVPASSRIYLANRMIEKTSTSKRLRISAHAWILFISCHSNIFLIE